MAPKHVPQADQSSAFAGQKYFGVGSVNHRSKPKAPTNAVSIASSTIRRPLRHQGLFVDMIL